MVRALDSPAESRRTAAQQIIEAAGVQSPRAEPERRQLVAALVNMGRGDSWKRNLLSAALAGIPKQDWDRPEWSDLEAGVRRVVSDFELRVTTGQIRQTPEMRQLLDQIKQSAGLDNPASNTVYFQFAGMTREDAVEISNRIKALRWEIPGGGKSRPAQQVARTESATGQRRTRRQRTSWYRTLRRLVSAKSAVAIAIRLSTPHSRN
jgi:hypothetical protein